jgi:two-component system cell cycle sensor histidine kinase/response regulator CckA
MYYAPATPSFRRLILVVDDAETVRLLASRALSDEGYDVVTAPDGQSAISVILGLRTPPDLVITDLRMPIVPGEVLAAWLTQHYPQVPVIFISGFPEDPDIILPGPLLEKPFSPAALCQVASAVLRRVSPAAAP